MIDRVEISILLDYYGELLTEKQQKIMNLYYNEDFSLSEIAELNKTSRQAIYDAIKRCYKQLLTYENKLGLMESNFALTEKKKLILEKLSSIKSLNKDDLNLVVKDIEDILEDL
ncbi:putative DNA-binding protein [Clostridium polynesiense]|uniref:putative DNA-binding protein n=1 Tax=Clostridium polynesiense TaxID=1325933 RepID=UPI00058ED54E|nr:putative DNA-binding protein [Clostridium polynesiense]